MSNLASTVTVLAAFFAAFGGWSFWVKAYLDARFAQIDARFVQIDARFVQIDGRLERMEGVVLRDHGERIARLETRSS